MKKTKIMALLLSATLVFSGCGNMNNTAKGGLIGGGGGAALGAIIGGIAGHGKGVHSGINLLLKGQGKEPMSLDDLVVMLFEEVEYVWPKLGYPPFNGSKISL